jgi:hypothetical protein
MAHAKKLPYAVPITGRDGKVRWYYRKRGEKDIRLPGLFGSPEFMTAYSGAVSTREPIEIGVKRAKAGSIASLVGLYLASAGFAALAPETRRTRRNIMERLREEHGDKPIALIERKHVKAMVDAKAATPTAARNLLQMLRVLMAFAIEAGLRREDPTIGVTHAKIKIKGHAKDANLDGSVRLRARCHRQKGIGARRCALHFSTDFVRPFLRENPHFAGVFAKR